MHTNNDADTRSAPTPCNIIKCNMHHVILKINYYHCLLVNIKWCQKCSGKMVSVCKPPDPLSLMGNVAQNWRDMKNS